LFDKTTRGKARDFCLSVVRHPKNNLWKKTGIYGRRLESMEEDYWRRLFFGQEMFII